MSSSVGRLDDESGMWGYNFLNSCCDFTEKMYDYDIETVKEMIFQNCELKKADISEIPFDINNLKMLNSKVSSIIFEKISSHPD